MKSFLIDTLQSRGLIHSATNLESLDDLATDHVVAYVGFDLTADSLHVGSLIQLMVLRWLKKLNHTPIILFGEATTRIGDPTGKSTIRPMLTPEQIEVNRVGIMRVIDRIVGPCRHVSNAEWMTDREPSFIDFITHYGRHFSLNRLLTLDSVKSRLSDQGSMSILEFMYPMMQAMDFETLFRHRDCMLQIGGSDQWGNIVNGVDLIRRLHGVEVFGLTTPLMLNSRGEKMGKTAGGAIWLDAEKTPVFDFWQFWRNVEDEKVSDFLRFFTEMPVWQIDGFFGEGRYINELKIILANEVTSIVHGVDAARECDDRARAIFVNGDLSQLDTIEVGDRDTLADIMVQYGLANSKGEADRLAAQGGVKIDGKAVSSVREQLSATQDFVLSVGKKKKVRLKSG